MREQCVVVSAFRGRLCASGCVDTVLEEFWDAADSKAADIGEQLAQWVSYYNWHRPHESLHGRSPIDRVCQLASQTPLWDEVGEAYDPKKERLRVRDHAVDIALQVLK